MRQLFRHLVVLIRSGQLRFRAETFGLYYPGVPEDRSWWQLSPLGLGLLARGVGEYVAWMTTMRRIADHGAHEWWGRRWPGIDLQGELSRLYREETGPR